MRASFFVLMPLVFATVSAQSTPFTSVIAGGPGGSISAGGGFSTGNVQVSLKVDPPSSSLVRSFGTGFMGHNGFNGFTFFERHLYDRVKHVYLGYELLLEEEQPGTYVATFGKLGLSPLEVAAVSSRRIPPNAPPKFQRLQSALIKEWTMLPLPGIPQPRIVHDGDTLSLDLFIDPSTGEKLIDQILIGPRYHFVPPIPINRPSSTRNVPTVSGDARDFSARDAEFQLLQPSVTLNGAIQDSFGRSGGRVQGTLIWIYIPKHGRYILSLAPRADLDFKKGGEVRGGALTFTSGGDSIKLECVSPIATGDAAYHLYVLRDAEWEPTAQAQKGQLAFGSVGVGELIALKRK